MFPLKTVSSLTLVISSILFAGCQQVPSVEKQPTPQVVLEQYTDTGFKFYCNQDTTIRVSYHPLQQNQRKMTLIVKGHIFPMYAVGDPNQLQFVAEQGLVPNKGMFWQQIGDKAQLRLLEATDMQDPTQAALIFQCQTTPLAASLETSESVETAAAQTTTATALEVDDAAYTDAYTTTNDDYVDPGEPARLPSEIEDLDSETSTPDLGQILNQF